MNLRYYSATGGMMSQELMGARRRGRPWKEWGEEVERDFQEIGVR